MFNTIAIVSLSILICFFLAVIFGSIILNKLWPSKLEKHTDLIGSILIAYASTFWEIAIICAILFVALLLLLANFFYSNIPIALMFYALAFIYDNAMLKGYNAEQGLYYKDKRKKYVGKVMLAYALIFLIEGAYTSIGVAALLFIVNSIYEKFSNKEDFLDGSQLAKFFKGLFNSIKTKDLKKSAKLLKNCSIFLLQVILIAAFIYFAARIQLGITLCILILLLYIAIIVTGIRTYKNWH